MARSARERILDSSTTHQMGDAMNRKSSISAGIGAAFVSAAVLVSGIMPVAAQSRAVRAEVARLGSLYAAATPGSPAQFRIHEELDNLRGADVPSSPADFRQFEEATD